MPKSLNIAASSHVEILAAALKGQVDRFGRYSTPEEIIEAIRQYGSQQYYDKTLHQAKQYNRNLIQYGYPTWYEWGLAEWGTKWNAYEQEFPFELNRVKFIKKTKHKRTAYRKRLTKKLIAKTIKQDGHESFFIRFDTAWSTPIPVLLSLSKKYPDAVVELKYADEDIGSNCGYYHSVNGKVIKEDIAEGWYSLTPEEKLKWRKFAIDLKYQIEDEDDLAAYGFNPDYTYADEE